MAKKSSVLIIAALLALPLISIACEQDSGKEQNPHLKPEAMIIDHNCMNFASIPDAWIDSAQANIRLHYAHTSHGGQLTTGLQRIEDNNAKYSVARRYRELATEADALCIFDGQETAGYITPDLYWQTHKGMNSTRAVLNNNPSINVSMWSWCSQLNDYSEAQVKAYLDSMAVLEAEFPKVTFVRMTCNAQATGPSGYNRYLRNEQIRDYCRKNKKVLFDFADLDAWWYTGSTWEHQTYQYDGKAVPTEHDHFTGHEAAHTTYESCEQKGKATWWMLARIAGWKNGGGAISEEPSPTYGFSITTDFAPSSISYTVPAVANVQLSIYDIQGRLVRTFNQGNKSAGVYNVVWDACDNEGSLLPQGTYFCQLKTSEGVKATTKFISLN